MIWYLVVKMYLLVPVASSSRDIIAPIPITGNHMTCMYCILLVLKQTASIFSGESGPRNWLLAKGYYGPRIHSASPTSRTLANKHLLKIYGIKELDKLDVMVQQMFLASLLLLVSSISSQSVASPSLLSLKRHQRSVI